MALYNHYYSSNLPLHYILSTGYGPQPIKPIHIFITHAYATHAHTYTCIHSNFISYAYLHYITYYNVGRIYNGILLNGNAEGTDRKSVV